MCWTNEKELSEKKTVAGISKKERVHHCGDNSGMNDVGATPVWRHNFGGNPGFEKKKKKPISGDYKELCSGKSQQWSLWPRNTIHQYYTCVFYNVIAFVILLCIQF